MRNNLYLIGFMGCGKTTVAREFCRMFSMEMMEMDEELEKRAEMSIPDIFARHGEAYFRDMETSLIKELRERGNTVVSCGGGAPLRKENVEAMKQGGTIVLLTASPETIYERVKDSSNRPVIEGNKTPSYIAELMDQRRPAYEAAADLTIETDGKAVPEICRELAERVGVFAENKG